jgi:3D (Asp-Asp-Asp) domain-containing protein
MRELTIGFTMMVAFVRATECIALALPLRAGAEIRVVATAYCQQGATESGAHTRNGIIAADPHVLEMGSLVRILDGSHRGIYTVLDTGGTVKGFSIDIFIKDCRQAETFGKQSMRIRVLRRGPEQQRTHASEWRGSVGDWALAISEHDEHLPPVERRSRGARLALNAASLTDIRNPHE